MASMPSSVSMFGYIAALSAVKSFVPGQKGIFLGVGVVFIDFIMSV